MRCSITFSLMMLSTLLVIISGVAFAENGNMTKNVNVPSTMPMNMKM
jgi:hypothetical protein